MPAKLIVTSSDPQTPYCATWSYDSTGVMMQSYQCTSSLSGALPYEYFYSVTKSVVGVLADEETVTPSGATSIETVVPRIFATASPPNFTSASSATTPTGSSSVSIAPSKTSTLASPSGAHSSDAQFKISLIVAILLRVILVVILLALGLSRCLRHRRAGKFRSALHCSWYSRNLGKRSSSVLKPTYPESGFAPSSKFGSLTFDGRPSLELRRARIA